MFDGVTLKTQIPAPEEWKSALESIPGAPRFCVATDTESGEIKTRNYEDCRTTTRYGKVGHYTATLKENEYSGRQPKNIPYPKRQPA